MNYLHLLIKLEQFKLIECFNTNKMYNYKNKHIIIVIK